MRSTSWPREHSEALQSMIPSAALSYVQITAALNKIFSTSYTRNAVIGRAVRMGLSNPLPAGWCKLETATALDRKKARHKRESDARRAERWARNPYLEELSERRQAGNKPAQQVFLNSGFSKTSSQYRRHLPHVKEMTKPELRVMLRTAIINTSEMVTL